MGEECRDNAISKHGISGLSSRAEVDKILWVKKEIHEEGTIVLGNVLKYTDVYKKYEQYCEQFEEKRKGERTVIGRIANVLAKFKIFVMYATEAGRGNTFFYNKTQVVIGSGQVHCKGSWRKSTSLPT